ncbi:MAG: TonB-dependent receptor plug domain-containing protein, partial [Alistipes sp.]|nr:TonB-dependent receptor plug domain-containing protein [Alistipes sp.]
MDLKVKLSAFLTLLAAGAVAQVPDIHRTVEIEQVTVTERRILEDIGAHKTVLDTVYLRDNVTNSMAEVLSQGTSVFIKSYGRATLSTASFRGTAPSHTQVTWNGMKMNSPMLGMVDFSLIPSYFVDDASLY